MTDFEEEIARNLAETWGAAATHSDYKAGDILRYQTPSGIWSGVIIWIAGPGESAIEGHADLPTRYIVERHGWSGFPDVVYSADILSGDITEEPTMEKCKYCSAHHYKGMMEYCPLNPNRPQ